MDYRKVGNDIIARFDKGDKIMASLHEIAEKEGIKSGFVSAIGAVDQAELSYYEIEEKTYKTVTFEKDFEVLSMNGTLTTVDGSPHEHIHIVLGRDDYSTIGGHLQEANVSITLEVHLTTLDLEVGRNKDEETGIQTLKFEDK